MKMKYNNLLRMTDARVARTKAMNTCCGSIFIFPSAIWRAKDNRASTTGMLSLKESSWMLVSVGRSSDNSASAAGSEGICKIDSAPISTDISPAPLTECVSLTW